MAASGGEATAGAFRATGPDQPDRATGIEITMAPLSRMMLQAGNGSIAAPAWLAATNDHG